MERNFILKILDAYYKELSGREQDKFEGAVDDPIVDYYLLEELKALKKNKVKINDKYDVRDNLGYYKYDRNALKKLWGRYDELASTIPEEELSESEIMEDVIKYIEKEIGRK